MRPLTMSDMRTAVGRNVGIIDDSSYNPKILGWMNEVYLDIWDKFIWPGTLIRGSVTTTTGQDFINFPPQVRRVLMLSQASTPAWMRFSDSQDFVREFYADLTTQGTPTDWTEDGWSPVMTQPGSASVITVVSNSTSDISQTVRIQGRNANEILLSESIQLNGTTSVAGTNTYKASGLEVLNKSAISVGIVTATAQAGSTTVARIAPTELDDRRTRARLFLVPDAALTITFIAKKHPIRLVNAEDMLMLQDLDAAVVAGATALALREQGDPKSELWADRAGFIVQSRIDEILGQGMRTLKLTPDLTRKPLANFRGDFRR